MDLGKGEFLILLRKIRVCVVMDLQIFAARRFFSSFCNTLLPSFSLTVLPLSPPFSQALATFFFFFHS